MLERMEKGGLILRRQDSADKRKTLLFLTDKARDLEQDYIAVSEEMGDIYYQGFTEEEVKKSDTLDFKWIDLEEKDERTVKEVLDDMQAESDGIAAAVSKLKELLGGIEI